MAAETTSPMIDRANPSLAAKAKAVQAMVDKLFARLDEAGIPYCLLRNRDLIPYGMLTWSDLDILVPAEATTSRLVDVLADLSPSQIVDVRPGLVIFSFPVEDLFIRVDICYGDLDWRGAPFVSADEVLAGRWNDNGIMVASLLHQTYVTWISKLIWSGFYLDRYTPLVQHAVREHPHQLHALLERAFGRQLADQMIDLARSDRLKESEALIPELQRSLWRRSLRRNPVKQLRASIGQTISRARTLVQPSGLVVGVIGPDRSVTADVCTVLSQPSARRMPCGRIDRLTDERRFLPSLSAISRRLPLRLRNMSGIGFMSTLVYTYDTFDYSFSHWRWTQYRLTRGRLVLDERDRLIRLLGLDRPDTNRQTLVHRWLNRLAPQPDLIVVLEASPEGDEAVSAAEDRQREAYRSVVNHRHNAHSVNADQPTERVVADVRDLIIQAYEDRTSRRFPRLSR